MDSVDERFAYQQQMSAFIYGQTDAVPMQWKCGPVIGAQIVTEIYRRNFHGGLDQHMKVQFPVTSRYLGDDGFRLLLLKFVAQQPPSSPLFAVYAASLPGFILQLEGFGDESLRQCTSMLATIDFFIGNADADQEFPVESRYYRLYNEIVNEKGENDDTKSGLYKQTHLHPQSIALEPADIVMLRAG